MKHLLIVFLFSLSVFAYAGPNLSLIDQNKQIKLEFGELDQIPGRLCHLAELLYNMNLVLPGIPKTYSKNREDYLYAVSQENRVYLNVIRDKIYDYLHNAMLEQGSATPYGDQILITAKIMDHMDAQFELLLHGGNDPQAGQKLIAINKNAMSLSKNLIRQLVKLKLVEEIKESKGNN